VARTVPLRCSGFLTAVGQRAFSCYGEDQVVEFALGADCRQGWGDEQSVSDEFAVRTEQRVQADEYSRPGGGGDISRVAR
jgi:hypothetical protein